MPGPSSVGAVWTRLRFTSCTARRLASFKQMGEWTAFVPSLAYRPNAGGEVIGGGKTFEVTIACIL